MTVKKGRTFFGMISEVEITYDNYSDDGEVFFSGTEYARGSMMTKTTCTANLTAVDKSGAAVGRMDVKMIFSAAFGWHTITRQIKSPLLDVSGSHGTASWMDTSADISALAE